MEPESLRTPVRLSPEFDVTSFDCGDEDLNAFLVDNALDYQEKYLANTTLLFCEGQLVTYFSLASDAIQLSRKEKSEGGIATPFNSFPAVKIARLGTDVRFRRRGHGTAAVEFSVGLARHLNDADRHDGIACRFITVDAYPSAVEWYKSFGFVENESNRSRTDTMSLRLDTLPVFDVGPEGDPD